MPREDSKLIIDLAFKALDIIATAAFPEEAIAEKLGSSENISH